MSYQTRSEAISDINPAQLRNPEVRCREASGQECACICPKCRIFLDAADAINSLRQKLAESQARVEGMRKALLYARRTHTHDCECRTCLACGESATCPTSALATMLKEERAKVWREAEYSATGESGHLKDLFRHRAEKEEAKAAES